LVLFAAADDAAGMILVTGASGNVGREVVAALRARGEEVRAVVRDPSKVSLDADVIAGDLELPESLVVDGADAVFLLGGWSDMPGLVRRIGDRRIVLLTSRCVIGGRPDNAITRMWLDAEAAVAGSDATILRPSGFQSNALRWLDQLRTGDVVRAPWPDVPIAAIDPADIGAVAAVALTTGAPRALELSGPEPLTPGEQVATLAQVLERPLRYEPVEPEGGNPFADAAIRFFSLGEYDDSRVVDTVRELTGREPGTFATWARAHAAAFG
jgi:uncharacterized protein YbjT (DUF2867 family)